MTLRLLEGRDRTVPAFLRTKAERNGDAVALRSLDDELSYAGAYEAGLRVANALRELGVRPGENVAVMMRNSMDFHRVWFGVNLAGAVEVPINTEYRHDGLRYVLEDSGARVLVLDAEFCERVEAIEDQLTSLEIRVVRGDGPGTTPLTDLLGASPDEGTQPVVDPGDLAAIMYTSGTTGPPKGVMLPQGCSIAWAEETIRHFRLRPGATHYCCYPLFHTLAQYFATMPALGNDGTLALGERFSVSRFWDEVRHFGASSSNMMGSTISLLYAEPERDDDLDNPLEVAFGAPAPPSIVPGFERRFGLRFVEIYGSSEANVVLWNPYDDIRVGTCGTAIGRFDVRLVDEHDEEVPVGAVGEITTRPHEPHSMMTGYFGRPQATVAAFRNLWFHTGDLARRDADGYHTFVDRKKDAIRRRGENISSWEVETVLSSHPDVAEVAAFGVPSQLSDEDVMVVIVPNPGHDVDLGSIVEHCSVRMPRYMVPRYWDVVDELPRTQTGKVEKFRLREKGPSASTWDREGEAP